MILGLEFKRAEAINFAAPAHFAGELRYRQVRIQARRSHQPVRMCLRCASDEIVFPAIILHHGKGNNQRTVHSVTIHVAEQIVRARRATGMPRETGMRVCVEDPESVLHGSAARIASVFSMVSGATHIG